ESPGPAGRGSFIPAYKRRLTRLSRIPRAGRPGIVHSSLQKTSYSTLPNPPGRQAGDRSLQPTKDVLLDSPESPGPTGRGSFIPAYKRRLTRLSRIPRADRPGIVHSSLQKTSYSTLPNPPCRQAGDRSFQPTKDVLLDSPESPMPAGRGSFIPAYKRCLTRLSRIPRAGRPGIVHSSLQKMSYSTLPNTPCRQAGD